jgi:hypothetical protein
MGPGCLNVVLAGCHLCCCCVCCLWCGVHCLRPSRGVEWCGIRKENAMSIVCRTLIGSHTLVNPGVCEPGSRPAICLTYFISCHDTDQGVLAVALDLFPQLKTDLITHEMLSQRTLAGHQQVAPAAHGASGAMPCTAHGACMTSRRHHCPRHLANPTLCVQQHTTGAAPTTTSPDSSPLLLLVCSCRFMPHHSNRRSRFSVMTPSNASAPAAAPAPAADPAPVPVTPLYKGKKAVVVGAGPAGSAAAMFLARQGFSVDVSRRAACVLCVLCSAAAQQ